MEFSNDDLPPLKVAVTEFDRGEHLDKVVGVFPCSLDTVRY